MKECMRELKAYKAAMQSLPSGCLAAEAEAEKQEKLSVEMTGSQTGPIELQRTDGALCACIRSKDRYGLYAKAGCKRK